MSDDDDDNARVAAEEAVLENANESHGRMVTLAIKELTEGAKKNDVRAQVSFYQTQPALGAKSLMRVVREYWRSLKKEHEPSTEITLDKKPLWNQVFARFEAALATMTETGAMDADRDIVIYLMLGQGKTGALVTRTPLRADAAEPALALQSQIMAGRVILLSSYDVVGLARVTNAKAWSAQIMQQINYFWTRVQSTMSERQNKYFEPKTHLTVLGEPLDEHLRRERHVLCAQYDKEEKNTFAIFFSVAEKLITDLTVIDRDNSVTEENIDTAYKEKLGALSIFLLDMRPQYKRFRGWLPALLTWTLPPDAPPPVRAKRRKPKKASPEAPTSTPSTTNFVARTQFGVFEKGNHALQKTLNALSRDHLPAVGRANDLQREMLRLSVLAYQVAFDGVTIESVMARTSGFTIDDDLQEINVFVSLLAPRMVAFSIRPTEVLTVTQTLLDAFDRFLALIIGDQKSAGAEKIDVVMNPAERNTAISQQGRFPNLMQFFFRFHTTPFGALGRSESRLRAALKSFKTGQFSDADSQFFSAVERADVFTDNRKKFELISNIVSELAVDYVQTHRITSVPADMSLAKYGPLFALDVQNAHQATSRFADLFYLPALRLLELFAIVGENAGITFASVPLAEYIATLAEDEDDVAVCYSLQRGLYVRPTRAENVQSPDFVFNFGTLQQPSPSHGEASTRDTNRMKVDMRSVHAKFDLLLSGEKKTTTARKSNKK